MPRNLARIVRISLTAALIGAIYSWFAYASPVVGAMVGAGNGAALPALEIYLLRGETWPALQRASFPVFLATRAALYALVIFAVFFVVRLIMPVTLTSYSPSGGDVAFSLAMCLGFNVIVGISDLLGPGALVAFIGGKYHVPQQEERALLFVDMRNSTAAAERLGEARFLELLNAFFEDVALAVTAEGGAIHKYVGDEAIATWPLKAGPNAPQCVEAGLAVAERLAARAATYEREFGAPVEIRAALHGGAVIVGELGYGKREIALIGDAMNTTARLLEACRETGKPLLISEALLARLAPLGPSVAREPLPPIALRGKAAPLALAAISRA